MPPPTREELEQLITAAWRLVRDEDPRLDLYIQEPGNDRLERAAVFRLATHLDALVSVARVRWPPRYQSLTVDVELARRVGGVPKIRQGESPDIVVHVRGDDGANLLAVECKTSRGWSDNEDDRRKLRALTDGSSSTRYDFGVRVKLDFSRDLDPTCIEWFQSNDSR